MGVAILTNGDNGTELIQEILRAAAAGPVQDLFFNVESGATLEFIDGPNGASAKIEIKSTRALIVR